MSTNSLTVSEESIEDVLTEIQEASYDIPFENSAYQNRAFVVAAQQTPGRALRAILLRMNSKIRAVQEYQIQQERNQIDIEEKEAMIASDATSIYDKRRLALDIKAIQNGQVFGRKLLNDALAELDTLYREFKKLPTYTRLTFEEEEVEHFAKKLTRQIEAPGSHESLANMTKDLPNWDATVQHASHKLLK